MATPPLNELTAVTTVAAHRSFRAAARELGMSPSAVSHAVSALEQRMGVRLFHRSTRSVAPTAACEQFLARITPALRTIAEAVEETNVHRDQPGGTLRINASEGAAQRMLSLAGYAFLKRYPDMQLDIVTDTRLVDIVAEGFDAGIRQRDQVPQDMVAVPCTRPLRFVVVGAPAYFARHGRPAVPTELQGHSCIGGRLAGSAPYPWEFAKDGQRLSIAVAGVLTVDAPHLAMDAARQGLGLAWVSEWSAEHDIAAGSLSTVLDDWAESVPEQCLYYSGHRHVPAGLQALVAVLRELH